LHIATAWIPTYINAYNSDSSLSLSLVVQGGMAIQGKKLPDKPAPFLTV
jgi:hypothetical protein